MSPAAGTSAPSTARVFEGHEADFSQLAVVGGHRSVARNGDDIFIDTEGVRVFFTRSFRPLRLGEIFVRRGRITRQDVEIVLLQQKQHYLRSAFAARG